MDKIKKFLKSLYQIKLYIIIFIFFLVVFVRFEVKDNYIINSVLSTISNETGMSIEQTGGELSFFPSLGITFKKLVLDSKNFPSQIKLKNTKIFVPLLSLLLFSPELDLKTEGFGGKLEIYLSDIPLSVDRTSSVVVSLILDNIILNKIVEFIIPDYMNIDLQASMSGAIDGRFNVLDTLSSNIDISLNLASIGIPSANVMSIKIPNIMLKKGSIVANLKNKKVNVSKLELGGKGDDIELKTKGNFLFNKDMPYNFSVRLKTAGEIKSSTETFLIMAGDADKQGFYNFNIKGSKKALIPQITPK